MKTKIIHISIFLLLIVGTMGCSFFKAIKIEHLGQVKMSSVTDTCLTIEVAVVINNPNFYKLNIQDLNADIFLGDEKFGTIKPCGEICIEANSTKEYAFCSQVTYKNVISRSLLIFKTFAKGSSKFTVKGEMTVGNFLLHFKVPINRTGVVRFTE